MRIRVRYLLWLRDKAGVDVEEYVFNEQLSLKALVDVIRNNHPGLTKFLETIWSSDNPIIIVVNGFKRPIDYVLNDGDEVVLMPPVSGG